jgi:photosystem II stability/assembly factor-like uncharacterized protein
MLVSSGTLNVDSGKETDYLGCKTTEYTDIGLGRVSAVDSPMLIDNEVHSPVNELFSLFLNTPQRWSRANGRRELISKLMSSNATGLHMVAVGRFVVFSLKGTAVRPLLMCAGLLVLGTLCRSSIVAQWIEPNVPAGAGIFPALISGASGNGGTNLYLGSDGGGIHRSTDYGRTWTTANTGLLDGVVHSLLFLPDSSHGGTVYAGTYGGGVYSSTNGGEEWTDISIPGEPWSVVSALCITPDASGGRTLLAGAGTSIYFSADNGTTWHQGWPHGIGVDYPSCFLTLSDGQDGHVILVGTRYAGLHRSTNDGADWYSVGSGITDTALYALVSVGNALFLGTNGGVFKSTDEGNNWVSVKNGLPNATVFSLTVSSAENSSGNLLFAGTKNGVYVSADSGAAWTVAGNGLPSTSVYAITSTDSGLFVTTNGYGVFRSTDEGNTWSTASTGLTSCVVNKVVQFGSELFAGTLGGVLYSGDNGVNWETRNQGLQNTSVNTLLVHDSVLYAGARGGVFRSTDHGASWSAFNNGLSDTVVHSLAGQDSCVFAATDSGLYRSDDRSPNWTLLDTRVLPSYPFPPYSLVVAHYPSGKGVLFMGCSGGILRSTDLGSEWSIARVMGNGIWCLAVQYDYNDSVTVYAGTWGFGYERGMDTTWGNHHSDTMDDVRSFAASGSIVLAGTYAHGVWISTDWGLSWQKASTGIPNGDVSSLFVGTSDIFVGMGSNFYKRPISEVLASVPAPSAAGPVRMVLWQNYPNPFNPTTTIRYDIAKESHVVLKVYNILGQEVATLVDAMKRPGQYSAVLDGTRLASGVYFYRLQARQEDGGQAGSVVDTKKLLLLR